MKKLFAFVLIPLLILNFQISFSYNLSKQDKQLLLTYAKATFKFFEKATEPKTKLPLDGLVWEDGNYSPSHVISDKFAKHNYNTSPTNIGLYLASIVAAYDLGIINKNKAISMIKGTLVSVKKLKTYTHRGKKTTFLYNWYDTRTLGFGKWKTNNGYKTDPGIISSVDNGWYAAGLIVALQAFKELEKDIRPILDGMKWDIFLRKDTNRLAIGIDPNSGNQIGEYGLIATEARIASFIGIGKGDLPKSHWWSIKRVFHTNFSQGKFLIKDGVTFFEGYEEIVLFPDKINQRYYRIVPSWGGSMFEFLMPTLFMKEKELGANGLGKNDRAAVQIQIDWAKGNKYDVWGFSPCAVPSPKEYCEFGIPGVGVYNHDFYGYDLSGYSDKMLESYGNITQKTWANDPVVTPYASFLALEFNPEEALNNIKKLDKKYKAFSNELGFCDAVNPRKREIHRAYLTLDNAMIMLSIDNYVNNGLIRNRFHSHPWIKRVEGLLKDERMEVGIFNRQ